MVSGNFTLNLWFTFLGPGHSICWAQVDTTLGFPSGSKNWPFKRFSTTMLRAMGQQKRSKRTTSNSIDRFWNQICHIFPSCGLYRKKKHVFQIFGAYLEGDAVRSTKGCARVCRYKMQCVRDKSHPETRTLRIESVLCGWKELWAWIPST